MFTLYSADFINAPSNCSYPHKFKVTDSANFADAVSRDYGVAVIKKQREQQMRCDGDVPLVHSKPAVALGGGDVFLHISGIGRADVHDGTEGRSRPFFLFYG